MSTQPSPESTVLRTARLRLRPMLREDLDFVHAILADPEAMRHYPKCLSREEAADWIERHQERYRQDGCGLWIAERSDGTPVGMIGLMLQEIDGIREPEVGYLVHRDHWRNGYAKEAALAVRDMAMDLRGHGHVISLIRPSNLPSQAVARSIGMSQWKTTRFKGLEHLVFRIRRTDRKTSDELRRAEPAEVR